MRKKEMESLGLIFEVQWKNNPGEKIASIGIWDKEDTSLDWSTFKSYLAQNLGTTEHISVAYIDNEGDEVPIESECEFEEALKYARQCARNETEILLRVELIPNASSQNSTNNASVNTSKAQKVEPKKVETKQISKEKSSQDLSVTNTHPSTSLKSKSNSSNKSKSKIGYKHVEPFWDFKDQEKQLADFLKKVDAKKDDFKKKEEEPPAWFKKYMKKFKNEIVSELKSTVTETVREAIKKEQISKNLINGSNSCAVSSNSMSANDRICLDNGKNLGEEKSMLSIWVPKEEMKQKQKQKKKSSDEDSSDNNQRDSRLLRKIEKLHRSGEKKFEKLDSKLEKLENKTKRLLEKKSQSKSRSEKKDKSVETVDNNPKLRKNSSDISMHLMDAVLLEKPSNVIYCPAGQFFVKIWNVMNNGTLPWTDKTELCLSWGTPGLKFEQKVLKCPDLEPGEKAQIVVRGRAPDTPGTFESYWHFYHMGGRFGHWLDCTVVVGGDVFRWKNQACENTKPVDLFDYYVQNKLYLLSKYRSVKDPKKKLLIEKLLKDFDVLLSDKNNAGDSYWPFQMDCFVNDAVRRNSLDSIDEFGSAIDALEVDSIAEMLIRKKKKGTEENCKKAQNDDVDENRLEQADRQTRSQSNDGIEQLEKLKSKLSNLRSLLLTDMIKQNQRKIEANMLQIQHNINLLKSPPNAKKILEMAFGDEFPKEFADEILEESDNLDDFIDLNHITGKNIEPAEWETLQKHPEFMKGCDLLKQCKHVDEKLGNLCGDNVNDEVEIIKENKKEEYIEIVNPFEGNEGNVDFKTEDNNNLNKSQETSDTFHKNIEGEEEIEEVKEDKDDQKEMEDKGEDPEYDSDTDSELSVISPMSSSSESEEDKAFILVNMPSDDYVPDWKTCQLPDDSESQKETKVMNETQDLLDFAEIAEPDSTTSLKENPSIQVEEPKAVTEKEEACGLEPNLETDKKQENDTEKPEILTVDATGKTIYAVTSNGFCFPVELLLDNHFKDVSVNQNRKYSFGESDKKESKNKKLKSSAKCNEYRFGPSELRDDDTDLHRAPEPFQFTGRTNNEKSSFSGKKSKETSQKSSKTCKASENFNFTYWDNTAFKGNEEPAFFCSECNNRTDSYKMGRQGRRFWRHSVPHNHFHSCRAGNGKNTAEAPAVDILPNALVNGAINVASSAINTARTVFSNLHSAFTPDGCTLEQGHPAGRPEPPGAPNFSEASSRLFEMGFSDLSVNRHLLRLHNNDLIKVIDELLAMSFLNENFDQ